MSISKAQQWPKSTTTQSANWSLKWRRMEKEREARLQKEKEEEYERRKQDADIISMDRGQFLDTIKAISSLDIIKKHLESFQKCIDDESIRLTVQNARSLLSSINNSSLLNSTPVTFRSIQMIAGIPLTIGDVRYFATSTIDEPTMVPEFLKCYARYDDEQMFRIQSLHVRGLELLEEQVPEHNKHVVFTSDDIEEFCQMDEIQNVPPYRGLSIAHIFMIVDRLRKSITDPDLEHKHSSFSSRIITYSSIAWEMYVTNWSSKGLSLFSCRM